MQSVGILDDEIIKRIAKGKRAEICFVPIQIGFRSFCPKMTKKMPIYETRKKKVRF